ncbi:hypothetical protein RJ40_01520 [Methanofollis aquaemaris]|uniref:Uncharacterized protein n=1 Tax=Methanofollis aquaemaris TaxID=126734 RepID=A0A8A3S322_9EURY|nr:hypothetical protein [Methanofollis aquaemaris]QSZ66269.1 hypothetical protein RJ40_01520 [Methanofollis aquaemaris]
MEWHLEYFHGSIESTNAFFDKIEVDGKFRASYPYRRRSEARYLLSYLEGAGVDVSEYKDQYTLLNTKWEATEKHLGKPLRKKLMEEFQYRIDNYWRDVRSFLHPVFPDRVDDSLDRRNSIEILRAELRRDHDLHEIDIRIAALDRVLRFKYQLGIGNLAEEEIRRLDSWYFYLPPDPFWWAHPSLILAQRIPPDISSLHFARHGPDFGFSGEFSDREGVHEYCRQARNLAPLDLITVGNKWMMQEYFEQACHLASLRDGVEVYYQADLHNLIVYDRASNTLAAGNEKGEIQSYFRPEATGVSGVYLPYVDERDGLISLEEVSEMMREKSDMSFIDACLIPLMRMSEHTTDTLSGLVRQALDRYAVVIGETETHTDTLEVKGRYTARAPYCCKYFLGFLLDYYETKGTDLSSARVEYEQLNRRFADLEARGGAPFREQAFTELQFFVENYWLVVALVTVLEPYRTEIEQTLNERDALEILMMEMAKDHDLTEMKIQVDAFDELHRDVYSDADDRHRDFSVGIYADTAADYYPEQFWWRHLEK